MPLFFSDVEICGESNFFVTSHGVLWQRQIGPLTPQCLICDAEWTVAAGPEQWKHTFGFSK